MRFWLLAVAMALALAPVIGCRTAHNSASGLSRTAGASSAQNPKPMVVPATPLGGKIARVNANGRFVVVVFPIGHLPRMEQRLGVYRDGLKVGEIKITGPQLDDSVVADITEGDVHEGDAIRE